MSKGSQVFYKTGYGVLLGALIGAVLAYIIARFGGSGAFGSLKDVALEWAGVGALYGAIAGGIIGLLVGLITAFIKSLGSR
jgi:hypothetical protein